MSSQAHFVENSSQNENYVNPSSPVTTLFSHTSITNQRQPNKLNPNSISIPNIPLIQLSHPKKSIFHPEKNRTTILLEKNNKSPKYHLNQSSTKKRKHQPNNNNHSLHQIKSSCFFKDGSATCKAPEASKELFFSQILPINEQDYPRTSQEIGCQTIIRESHEQTQLNADLQPAQSDTTTTRRNRTKSKSISHPLHITESLEKNLAQIFKPDSNLNYLRSSHFIQQLTTQSLKPDSDVQNDKRKGHSKEYTQKLFQEGVEKEKRLQESCENHLKLQMDSCPFTPLVHQYGKRRTNKQFLQDQEEYKQTVMEKNLQASMMKDIKEIASLSDRPQLIASKPLKQLDKHPDSEIPVHSRLFYLYPTQKRDSLNNRSPSPHRFYKTKQASDNLGSQLHSSQFFQPSILQRSKQLVRNNHISEALYNDFLRRERQLESTIDSFRNQLIQAAQPCKWLKVHPSMTDSLVLSKFRKEFESCLQFPAQKLHFHVFKNILIQLGFIVRKEHPNQSSIHSEENLILSLWESLNDPSTNTISPETLFEALCSIIHISSTNKSTSCTTPQTSVCNNTPTHKDIHSIPRNFEKAKAEQQQKQQHANSSKNYQQSIENSLNPQEVSRQQQQQPLNLSNQEYVQQSERQVHFSSGNISTSQKYIQQIQQPITSSSRSTQSNNQFQTQKTPNAQPTTQLRPTSPQQQIHKYSALNQNRIAYKVEKSRSRERRNSLPNSPKLSISSNSNKLAKIHRKRVLSLGQTLFDRHDIPIKIPQNGDISHPQLLQLSQLLCDEQLIKKQKQHESLLQASCSFSPSINKTRSPQNSDNKKAEKPRKLSPSAGLQKSLQLYQQAIEKQQQKEEPRVNIDSLNFQILEETKQTSFTTTSINKNNQMQRVQVPKESEAIRNRSIDKFMDRMKRARENKQALQTAIAKGFTNSFIIRPKHVSIQQKPPNSQHQTPDNHNYDTFRYQQLKIDNHSDEVNYHSPTNSPWESADKTNSNSLVISEIQYSIKDEVPEPILRIEVNLGQGQMKQIIVHQEFDEETRSKFMKLIDEKIKQVLNRIEEEHSSIESEIYQRESDLFRRPNPSSTTQSIPKLSHFISNNPSPKSS